MLAVVLAFGLNDREDINQEITTLILRRLKNKNLDESSVHYIRSSTWWEANKACKRVVSDRANEAMIVREAKLQAERSGRRIPRHYPESI